MRNNFIYIDGENLSKETIIDCVSTIKESMTDDEVMIGKLYGGKDHVKRSVQYCLLNGFNYVETSVLSTSRKNTADMKIIVDCIADVIPCIVLLEERKKTGYCTEKMPKVTLLSTDVDFFPLIYKLKELGVTVSLPLYNLDNLFSTEKTTADLDAFLKQLGFYSPKNTTCLNNIFDEIRSVVGNEYNDDIIEEHIQVKTRRFLNYLGGFIEEEMFKDLLTIRPRDFSFKTLIKKLKISDPDLLDKLYIIFISKIFGFIPKNKTLPGSFYVDMGISYGCFAV